MKRVSLSQIAHARAGDKGDICNVGLFARDNVGYALIKEQVTAARVKRHFKGLVKGNVVRYEVPNVRAFNFVMSGALDGGGARSLRIDTLGKSMTGALLRLKVTIE